MLTDITLTYSDDGVAAASDHVYVKDASRDGVGYFENELHIQNSVPGRNDIKLVLTRPKITGTYYGNYRHTATLGQTYDVETPVGVQLKDAVIKVEASVPVGVNSAEKGELLRRFRSFIACDAFENYFLSNTY